MYCFRENSNFPFSNQKIITLKCYLYCKFVGGPLTITDANLCLNRLLPNYFPKIFGKTQDRPLDTKATMKAFENLTKEVL